MPIVPIEDPTDPRLQVFGAVRDPALLREHGLFVAEGRRAVGMLAASTRFETHAVLLTDAAQAALGDALDPLPPATPIYLVPKSTLLSLVRFQLHQGAIAAGVRPTAAPEFADLVRDARRVVIAEGVTDPDNIGAVFRAAWAFDVDAVLLSPGAVDPLYRKAIRTSLGASLRLPFTRLGEWPAPIGALRDAGWHVVGLTPDGDRALGELCADPPDRIAVVLGTEGEGLSELAKQAVTTTARIAMAPRADSLNVATAAAIALHALRP